MVSSLARVLDWPENTRGHDNLMERALYLAGELHATEIQSIETMLQATLRKFYPEDDFHDEAQRRLDVSAASMRCG